MIATLKWDSKHFRQTREAQPLNSPADAQDQAIKPISFKEYFLPGEDINREVIERDIVRHLGNDATVRPYQSRDGRQGYLIRASRVPTTVGVYHIRPWFNVFCLIMTNLGNNRNIETGFRTFQANTGGGGARPVSRCCSDINAQSCQVNKAPKIARSDPFAEPSYPQKDGTLYLIHFTLDCENALTVNR
jgi:hypothetical protein